MPRPEIVDGEAHTGNFEELHVPRREMRIAHHRALGDLEQQRRRLDPPAAQQVQDLIPQVRVENVRGRKVDRDIHFETGFAPLAHLANGRLQHPTRETARATGRLGERHEFSGRYRPQLRMRPADQCLEALH